jgi:hypothetical protein
MYRKSHDQIAGRARGWGFAFFAVVAASAIGLSGCSADSAGPDPQLVDNAVSAAAVTGTADLSPVTLGYTGQETQVTVPNGVDGVQITATGGAGGNGDSGTAMGGHGGSGAQVTGQLAVKPGLVLTIAVGQQGRTGGGSGKGAGGWGDASGGGSGGGHSFAGGGGGATTITLRGQTVLVAAGGGGGGDDGIPCPGGDGGTADSPPHDGKAGDCHGSGAGGLAASMPTGAGGSGAQDAIGGDGGGGGGGLDGGGGGSAGPSTNGSGGGGGGAGSSTAGMLTNAAITSAPDRSDGSVVLQWQPAQVALITQTAGWSQPAVPVGQEFEPISVWVTDRVGNPVPGIPVTFMLGNADADFTGGVPQQTVVTDDNGAAAAPTITAVSPGTVPITAHAGDVTTAGTLTVND